MHPERFRRISELFEAVRQLEPDARASFLDKACAGDEDLFEQVQSLLEHSHFQAGPTLLLGDMNAWRRCKATRALDDELRSHHNQDWPASFPSARPVLALDRIYSQGVRVMEIAAHTTRAARRASDHLPVVARVELPH